MLLAFFHHHAAADACLMANTITGSWTTHLPVLYDMIVLVWYLKNLVQYVQYSMCSVFTCSLDI